MTDITKIRIFKKLPKRTKPFATCSKMDKLIQHETKSAEEYKILASKSELNDNMRFEEMQSDAEKHIEILKKLKSDLDCENP